MKNKKIIITPNQYEALNFAVEIIEEVRQGGLEKDADKDFLENIKWLYQLINKYKKTDTELNIKIKKAFKKGLR